MNGTMRTQNKKNPQIRQEIQPSAVLFVPRTHNGTLASLLKEKEMEINKISRRKIKIIEKTGTQIQRILTKADPWGDPPCQREDCMMCAACTEDSSRCRKQNTVYENSCRKCKESGETIKYIGETSRSTYQRSAEHLQDLMSSKEGSHMAQHIRDKHPELQGTITSAKQAAEVFKMQIVRKHSNCMTRQIHEAIRIARAGETVLNNKDEYTRCTIPTLSVSKMPPKKPEANKSNDQTTTLTEYDNKKKRPRTRSEARQQQLDKETQNGPWAIPRPKRQCRWSRASKEAAEGKETPTTATIQVEPRPPAQQQGIHKMN